VPKHPDSGRRSTALIFLAGLACVLLACSTPRRTSATVLPTAVPSRPSSTPRPTQAPSATPSREPAQPQPAGRTSDAEQVLFRDDFEGALADGWSWLDERLTDWSLTDSGALRVVTIPGEAWCNALLRQAPPADFTLSTRVTFGPVGNFAAAMLYVRQDGENGLLLGRAYCDLDWCAGNAIYLDYIKESEFTGSNFATVVDSPSLAYLRLSRRGDTFTGYYSPDGTHWTTIGQHTVPLRNVQVGLVAHNAQTAIPAEFDFFEITGPVAVASQPTRAATPSRTPTPTPTPTPTATPAPTQTPTLAPCLPGASFAADVTVPDGTVFDGGTAFTKVWRMVSDGCAPWPAGATWAFVSGEQMGAPDSIPVPDTPLGSAADLSVDMVAPNAPGPYQGKWQVRLADGTPIGDPAFVAIQVRAPPPRRLATGTIIREVGARNGRGELAIDNGLDVDAVAVLTQQGSSWLFAVYVLNHGTHTIGGIPDGNYELYFTLGEDWDAEAARFTRKRSLSRFEEPFPYVTTDTTYSSGSVTLHPVAGGSASTEGVPEDAFPDLK
jgi:regulation of enolase protein 1 (concanavalin A-like superfamily)